MRIKNFTTAVLVWLFFIVLSLTSFVLAEEPFKEENLEGIVVSVLEEKEVELMDGKQLYQKLELLITKGSLKDKKIIIESGSMPMVNQLKYKEKDKLMVMYGKDFEGNDLFTITDYIRRGSLGWLFMIFIILAIFIGKWWGLASLVGMGFSFLVILKFILPKLLIGANPIMTAVIGSFFIIPVTFYLSHGFNKKTSVAIAGTIIALLITGVLASIFVDAAKLTGFASEEAGFLQVARQGVVNIKGLLLAGIIIGALGVLDDVTVSQAAIVNQLRKADKKLSAKELYKRAMSVGQDHISSMVNTLVLVYTGAALPLLLLFIDNSRPFLEVINYEIIADEIVRTLVGSIGLILAVPITTMIASAVMKRDN